MAVVGVAMQDLCSHDPIVLTDSDKTRFAAKLIPLVRFAFGNASHFRGMNCTTYSYWYASEPLIDELVITAG